MKLISLAEKILVSYNKFTGLNLNLALFWEKSFNDKGIATYYMFWKFYDPELILTNEESELLFPYLFSENNVE